MSPTVISEFASRSAAPEKPQSPYGRCDGLAAHGGIDAMPMIRRQAGNVGEAVEVDLILEMFINVIDHPVQARLVTGK